MTPTFTVVNLAHGQTLKVSPRGWYPDPSLYASTRGSFPGAATDPKAPAVNGQPAYWDSNGIMWEYAPDAWAYLYGAGNTQTHAGQALDEQMAGKVRFGRQQTALHALPAQPRAACGMGGREDRQRGDGRAAAGVATGGPAVQPQALTIADDPQGGVCDLQPPQSTLTADGIQWTTTTPPVQALISSSALRHASAAEDT